MAVKMDWTGSEESKEGEMDSLPMLAPMMSLYCVRCGGERTKGGGIYSIYMQRARAGQQTSRSARKKGKYFSSPVIGQDALKARRRSLHQPNKTEYAAVRYVFASRFTSPK